VLLFWSTAAIALLSCKSLQERTAGWSLGNSRLTFVSAVVFNTKSQAYFAAVSNADKAHQVLPLAPGGGGWYKLMLLLCRESG